jgi:predicted RNase H-like HicB family nuclease
MLGVDAMNKERQRGRGTGFSRAVTLSLVRGPQMTITIKAARDAEGGVWYIADSDLPGLNLEGESLDELYDKLFHGIEELTGEPKVEFELVVMGRRWPALV